MVLANVLVVSWVTEAAKVAEVDENIAIQVAEGSMLHKAASDCSSPWGARDCRPNQWIPVSSQTKGNTLLNHSTKHNYLSINFQHHRGWATSQEVWVFGLCDTSHSPSRGYMQVVPSRDAATLLPIIRARASRHHHTFRPVESLQPCFITFSSCKSLRSQPLIAFCWPSYWHSYTKHRVLMGKSKEKD